ncbi:MAG: dynamin family protein [Candidatus Nitricoxidivorans perseverans]|uniref:Dynamin family protein n=1 Tax=Candidatus Nitricoxidivorans perseverans TaxID=2975601 RepID=A0AA49FJE9_9PROT|nr:MAG: dynamin family protein [Candidatus Nitricoxidivorans perseverans]
MSLASHFDSYRLWRDSVSRLVERLRDWLAASDLLDAQTEQRLRRLSARLSEDRLVVAFIAEFSRGKSELINALFFADRGGRLLPSAAGRTTMCPTELSWERGRPTEIALLPIESRLDGASIAELRQAPEAWQSFPIDAASAETMGETLRRVGEIKRVPAESARALGFAVGDGADGSLRPDEDNCVDIPRWRHALINFPHPLLEQGLVVLDTPGLNAIGAEPELTLSLLPGAHAVLFILAADTGVTQSDLAVWRDHVGPGPGRLVVLNKIDGLWDGLRTDAEIDGEIARQAGDCARILDLSPDSIFPVSAQKGLVAKIGDDPALLEKSRLPALERALAEGLLPARREIIARGTAEEALGLAGEVRGLLETRLEAFTQQFEELAGLRGKNQNVVRYMMHKVKGEKDAFDKSLREYYAVRSVYSRLTDALFAHLGMETLRGHARSAREAMRRASFTPQLQSAMGGLFEVARASLARSEQDVAEIAAMMTAARGRFAEAHGLHIEPPAAFSLGDRLQEIDRLEDGFRRQFNTFLNLLTRDKRTLTQQFFETVASQIRKTFEAANRDVEQWLRTLMAPLEAQVREIQRQLKRRLENIRRIHEAADTLEDRIEEMEHAQALLDAQINELDKLEASLEATLRAPERPQLRAAA